MGERDSIRVGLIGHGLAGAYIHAPLIEAVPALQIVLVATTRKDTLALRSGAPRAAADPLEACTAEDVDLVVVASPNATHAPLAAAALEAGKHVVVDKPFALSTVEADRLIALAQTRGRLLSVFQNRRWDGDFRAVSQALAAGELGDVALYEARWDRFRPEAAPGWRNAADAGAGLLWDLGPHLIDQALRLFGPPDSWTADIALQRQGAQADDYFELTFRYGAMRCVLSASSVVAAVRPRFAVHGSRGSLLSFGVDPIEAALRRGEKPADTDFRAGLPSIPGAFVDAGGERRERLIPAGDWTAYYADIAEAIGQGRPPAVSASEARAHVAIIEAVHGLSA
jgi:scyllo-inositol 2-dehydrogenase (NADP+)